MLICILASYLFVVFVIWGMGAYKDDEKFLWYGALWPLLLVYLIPAAIGYNLMECYEKVKERRELKKKQNG